MLGSAPCGANACATLVRTTDGGRSWHAIPAPADALGSGDAAGPGVSYVRFADLLDGWTFGPDLWSTHDGGAHWAKQSVPGGTTVTSLETTGGTAYALGITGSGGAGGGSAQVLQSPAGSDAWAPVSGTQLSGVDSGIVLTSGAGVWLVAQTTSASGALLARTSTTWVHRSLPCAQATLAVAASSASDLDAICSGGGAAGSESKQLFLSADAGQSWHAGGAGPLGGDTAGVATASPRTAVIGAASGASWIYATFDGGASWTTVYQDTSGRPWRDMGFTSPTQGVAIEGAVLPPQSGLPGNQMLITLDGGHTWAATRFA